MKIDPVRPEADIYFHNLTGFDGNDENWRKNNNWLDHFPYLLFLSFFPGAYILRSLPDFFEHSSVLGIGGEKFKTLSVSAMELRSKDQESSKFKPKDKEKDRPLEDWDIEGVGGVKFHFKDTCSFQNASTKIKYIF